MAGLLIIYSGGYNRFKSVAHEIDAIDRGFWMPQTVDFDATSKLTRGALRLSASDAGTFFGALTKAGSARRIVFIGHGSSTEIGLKADLYLFEKAVGVKELNKFHTTIQSKIKPLTQGKELDLITCNAGAGTEFPKALAKELGVTVRAFKGAVGWHVEHDKAKKKITSRGLICADRKCTKKIAGVHRFRPPVVAKP